jgi:hypothetical protein
MTNPPPYTWTDWLGKTKLRRLLNQNYAHARARARTHTHTQTRIYMYIHTLTYIYIHIQIHTHTHIRGRLQSSWTQLITPSRNFVEVRWRSLFRSTALGKRCTSYNAPPTSRKRAADRWSLSKFLASELHFRGWKSPEIARDEIWIKFCVRLGKSGSVKPH